MVRWRYRYLAPFALLLQLLDWGGRIGIGLLKPVVVADPLPQEIGSYIFLPLVAVALWFALPPEGRDRQPGGLEMVLHSVSPALRRAALWNRGKCCILTLSRSDM